MTATRWIIVAVVAIVAVALVLFWLNQVDTKQVVEGGFVALR
jgi:uncharacterized membrane protein YqhA